MFQTRALGLFSFLHIKWWFLPFVLTSISQRTVGSGQSNKCFCVHIVEPKWNDKLFKWLEKILLCFVMLPHFLPLSVSPICGAFSIVGSEEENNPHVWPSSGSESQLGVKTEGSLGRLNKQICSMIHKLTEVARSINDFKHPIVMFQERYETSYT